MEIVPEIRNSYEAYKNLMRDRHWETHRVYEWFGRQYALIHPIQLLDGLQRVDVIDITDIESDFEYEGKKYSGPPVARFTLAWPACNSSRQHVLVYHSDEGHDGILLESGSTKWVHYADLPIRIIPGTAVDYQTVRQQQMDELEESVDAGGRIEF